MRLQTFLIFCIYLLAPAFAIPILLAGPSQQPKTDDILVSCQSDADDISIDLSVSNGKAKIHILHDGKTYICSGDPEINDGHKNKIPDVKMSFEIAGTCNPKLSTLLKRKLRSEMQFRHNLLNKQNTFLWLAYSKELPCKSSQFKY